VFSVQFGQIGDTVWLDLNHNGMPDENLSIYGINGATVKLYNGLKGNPGRIFIGQTNTATVAGQRGYYLFTGLPIGNYSVECRYHDDSEQHPGADHAAVDRCKSVEYDILPAGRFSGSSRSIRRRWNCSISAECD